MKYLFLAGLVIFLAIGAVRVADSRYHSRQLMSEIYATKSSTDKLRLEWSQLLLEASTLTNEASIYQYAENKLNMSLPRAQEVVYHTY